MGRVKSQLLTEYDKYLHHIFNRKGWEPGWYYADETEDLNGPHPSKAAAADALHLYIKDNFP